MENTDENVETVNIILESHAEAGADEERLQFHSVSCEDVEQEEQVAAVTENKVVEEEAVEEEPEVVLSWLEADATIANRYTEEDPEFAVESAEEEPKIPIVTKWYGKSRGSMERRTQEMDDRKRRYNRSNEGDSGYHNHRRPRYDSPHNNSKQYSDNRHGYGHHRSFSGPDRYNRDQRAYSGSRHDARDHRPYYGHEGRDNRSYNSGPGYYGHRQSPGSGNYSRDHHGRRDDRRHDNCPPASDR